MRVPSLYQLKRAVLAPRSAWYRRRTDPDDQFGRAMLELHYYRPTIYRFVEAAAANPDILVTADLGPDSVVVDAGAYIGEWSEKIDDRYGCTIHAYEPVPTAFRRLRRRVGDRPRIHPHAYGLGASDEVVTMAVDGPGSAPSSAPGAFGAADVPIRDVAAVFDELGLEEIDLLKVNIEGGEYDLFDRLAETGWLDRIRVVSVQFHEWWPRAHLRRRRARRALARRHEEVWNYPWVWELWRRT